jgi:hypothetical protein
MPLGMPPSFASVVVPLRKRLLSRGGLPPVVHPAGPTPEPRRRSPPRAPRAAAIDPGQPGEEIAAMRVDSSRPLRVAIVGGLLVALLLPAAAQAR